MGAGRPWTLPPLYASQLKNDRPGIDDDQVFVRRLLESTLANYGKYSEMVYANARGWDSERLFLVDVVLVTVAIAEILNFPSVPVNVSLNEYVEISKYYGTTKSRSFVNVFLDGIVKQQKELQKFRDGLKKGDKVVTIGGIYGTVVEIKDKSVLVEVDKDVKIRVDKNAVQGDFSESEAASK